MVSKLSKDPFFGHQDIGAVEVTNQLRIHFAPAKNQQASESSSSKLKPRNSPQINLNEQIDQLEQQAAKVNGYMDEIDAVGLGQSGEAKLQAGAYLYENLENKSEKLTKGVNFLRSVLPNEYLRSVLTPEILEVIDVRLIKTEEMNSLAYSYITALELGLGITALVYKHKVLKKAREVLVSLQEEIGKLEQKNNPSPNETQEIHTLRHLTVRLETNIEIETSEFKHEGAAQGFKTTKVFLTFVEYNLEFLPMEHVAAGVSHLSIFAMWGASILGLIVGGIQVAKSAKHLSAFNKWEKKYDQWVENKQASVKWYSATKIKKSDIEAQSEIVKQWVNDSNWKEVTDFLTRCRVSIPTKIVRVNGKKVEVYISKKMFLKYAETPAFKNEILIPLIHFNRTLESENSPVGKSNQLLKKRKLEADQKLIPLMDQFNNNKKAFKKSFLANHRQKVKDLLQEIQVLPPHLVNSHQREFKELGFSSIPEFQSILELRDYLQSSYTPAFKQYFRELSGTQFGIETIINHHIDHQRTLEEAVKNSLKDLVKHKLKIDKGFLNLKVAESSILLSFYMSTTALTIACTILGITLLPLSGIGLIFLGLSAGLILTSIGFTVAGAIYDKCRSPLQYQLSQKTKNQILYAKIKLFIEEYRHRRIAAQLTSVDLKIQQLVGNESKRQKKILQSTALRNSLGECENNITMLRNRANYFSQYLDNMAWIDFLKIASHSDHHESKTYKSAFNTLQVLNDVLLECDYDLLSNETKYLLETVLGLDIPQLKEMAKDPEMKNSVGNEIQHYFIQRHHHAVKFIKNQQKLLERGFIREDNEINP